MDKEENIVSEPIADYQQPLSFEKVWLMFQETDKQFKETDKQFKKIAEESIEMRQMSKEAAKEYKEIRQMFKEIAEQSKETDRQFKETDRQFKETGKKLNQLEKLFTSQWGKLMESLVDGDLIKILNQRGIKVTQTAQRVKGNHKGRSYEFDIIASNGKEVVFVEVKTTLRPDDVKDFLEKLSKVKTWMSSYKENTIYGAMAYLIADGSSQVMAEKRGLFVIRATGSSASIINATDFKPLGF